MTAFFLYRNKQKADNVTMSAKEAGDKWKSMSDSEKKPYTDEYKKAKDKYDKYLSEQGLLIKSSGKKAEKPTCFKTSRIRAVCGHGESLKQMDSEIYKGFGKVLVCY